MDINSVWIRRKTACADENGLNKKNLLISTPKGVNPESIVGKNLLE